MPGVNGDHGTSYTVTGQKNIKKELKKGIQMTIDTLCEFGHRDAEIKTAIMRKYDISAEEVDEYL